MKRFEVIQSDYLSSKQVKGQIYRFTYKLKCDLYMPKTNLRLNKGSKILLYTITKYAPKSLVGFIEKKGWQVKYKPFYHQRVQAPDGVREYTMLAIFQ